MSEILSKLETYNIPVTSTITAIQYLSNKDQLSVDQYQDMLSDMADSPVKYDSQREARYTFLYFVQNAIKAANNTDVLDAVEILSRSNTQAVNYIKDNSWAFAAEDRPDNATPTVDANGKPKRKKGAKQEGAAQIYNDNKNKDKKEVIALFMSELDMSKAGATTYFYNMRKKFGV